MNIITLLAKASFWLLHEPAVTRGRSHHKGPINQSGADLREKQGVWEKWILQFSCHNVERKIDKAENAIWSYFTFMVSYS